LVIDREKLASIDELIDKIVNGYLLKFHITGENTGLNFSNDDINIVDERNSKKEEAEMEEQRTNKKFVDYGIDMDSDEADDFDGY
jgi:hypothetical protein